MTDWLLGTLVATSGLVVLVLLIREVVRKRFGSRVAYALWLIPAARLLMPTLTTTVQRTVPAATGLEALRAPVAEPIAAGGQALSHMSLWAEIGGWGGIALAIWMAIAVALFTGQMVAFRRERRAILAAAVEVSRVGSVRIVSSADVSGPVAFGILDRIIAVPADFERTYSVRERGLALEHELAHHRSGDLVVNFFAFVLVCLQWFNPLAWIAHAAFRFDQEAACDARVLDKAKAADRADYGRAIAKAASGRALLFASTLDRRNRLHRRLQSMLRTSNLSPTRTLAGRILIGAGVAVALPLTASRAVNYIDVQAPAPRMASLGSSPVLAPHAAVAAAAVAAPAPAPGNGDVSFRGDTITIDGRTKRWEELTPAEKNRVRKAVAHARAGLAKVHLDRQKVMQDVDSAIGQAQSNGDELQRSVTAARVGAADAMRNLSSHSLDLRRSGVDADRLKAELERSLNSARAVDIESIKRTLASIDRQKIAASVAGAEESIRRRPS